ncbi:MAG: hypothetical protein MUC87_17465 [Bacteroidia bacterium]|jgi:hypothetical protein|nr:hypothetical protein [Bacteroidia bacterium]
MKSLLIITGFLFVTNLFGQNINDQEIITLKSGYQLIGKVIEMQPGVSITIRQQATNDTICVATADIEKINRIVLTNNPDTLRELKPDPTPFKMFNTKKYMLQLSYINMPFALQQIPISGGSIAYLKSFNNKYFIGGSLGLLIQSKPFQEVEYIDEFSSLFLIPVLIENKYRLSFRDQRRRASLLLGFNCGYTFNSSYTYYESSRGIGMGAVTMQYLLGIKLNFDDNSGFLIEPGITYMPLRNSIYSGDTNTYKGHMELLVPSMLTMRISYFF